MKSAEHLVSIGFILSCLTISLSSSCKRGSASTIEIPELQIKEGQTVRTIMETVTENGTMRIVGGEQNGTGEMFVQRVRIFEKTRTANGYRYDIQKNDSTANFQWKNQEYPSETHTTLIGRPIVAKRGDEGWELELVEGNPSPEQEAEIEAFEAYANRDWLPGHPVKVGDSWPCKPGFIRHFVQSDLVQTDASGTLTLLTIEKGNAVISVNIQGKGEQADDKGTISKANINLIGTAVLHIETGLDLGLDLKGTVSSGVQQPNGEIKAVLLPVVIKVRKKILE